MQVVPAIVPQCPSSGPEEKLCEHASMLDLETYSMTLEGSTQVLPAQSSSSGPEEKPCKNGSELDLQSDLMALESLVKKWEEASGVRASATFNSDLMDIMSSKSFSGGKSFLGMAKQEDDDLVRTQTQAAFTRALIGLNNVACTSRKGVVAIASPAVLYVDKNLLVSTSYGDWLTRKGWMDFVVAILASMAAVVWVASRRVGETVVVYEDQHKLTHLRRSSGVNLLTVVSLVLVWFHTVHRVNRSIFCLLFQYFETIMVLGCQIGSSTCFIYNLYITCGRGGLYDVEWQVWNVLLIIFIHVPAAIGIVGMDSVRLEHHWLKTGVITSGLGIHMYAWLRERFYGTCWSMRPLVILGQQMGTPQYFYCMFEVQICLFLSKMLINYLMGYPWCVIRADYLRPHHFSMVVPGDERLTKKVTKDLAECLQERVPRPPPSKADVLYVQTIDSDH